MAEVQLSVMLPEPPALARERDEHHRHTHVDEHTLTFLEQSIELEERMPGGGPDGVSWLAALMHDVGKSRTRRFSTGDIETVTSRVELHLRFHGCGSGEWTDAVVRRYVRDAGDDSSGCPC